jgi:hypothetical protein
LSATCGYLPTCWIGQKGLAGASPFGKAAASRFQAEKAGSRLKKVLCMGLFSRNFRQARRAAARCPHFRLGNPLKRF